MKKIFFILLLLIIPCWLLAVHFTLAAYEIEVSIPGGPAAGTPVTLTEYIHYIYLFGLGLIGIAALGGLVYGGFMYMLSGTVTSKDEAKKWIWGAISGLVLGLASYLLLNTINPDLVSLRGPTLPPIEMPELPAAPPSPEPPSPEPPSLLTCEPGNCDPGCEAAANCAEPIFFWDDSFCECVYSGSTGP
ncbi:unnamed protein product [marine sediment metagenome]|uniref:Uncharacterized protein n=1 Tax=marine sediment metagenome TaxID=412755 RepID=X0TM46_9ZZZZ